MFLMNRMLFLMLGMYGVLISDVRIVRLLFYSVLVMFIVCICGVLVMIVVFGCVSVC